LCMEHIIYGYPAYPGRTHGGAPLQKANTRRADMIPVM
jgi:hypothetical protein